MARKSGTLPVVGEDDLFGGMNETGFSISWRVEDFSRKLVGRGHDDETAWGIVSMDTFGREFKLGTDILNTLTALKSPAFHWRI